MVPKAKTLVLRLWYRDIGRQRMVELLAEYNLQPQVRRGSHSGALAWIAHRNTKQKMAGASTAPRRGCWNIWQDAIATV